MHTYCRYVRWSAARIVGLRSEIRGEVPTGEAIIASKHQSFFDIIMIVSAVPAPKFIMKKEILWTPPIVGYYGKALGCIPVDRGKRGQAIKKMVADVKSGASAFGQLIIFPPQGTRVAAGGAHKKYKIGTGVLYTETGRPLRARRHQCWRVLEAPWHHALSGSGGGRVPAADRTGGAGDRPFHGPDGTGGRADLKPVDEGSRF